MIVSCVWAGGRVPGGRVVAGAHLIAPKDRPRTSCRCAIQPARMTGSVATVAAAHSRGKYTPVDQINPTRNPGKVAGLVAVGLAAEENPFQAKMAQISA